MYSVTTLAKEHYITFGVTQSNAKLVFPSARATLGNSINIEGSNPLTLARFSSGIIFNPYFAVEGLITTGLAEEDIISGPVTDTNGNTINYTLSMQNTVFVVSYLIAQYPIISNLNIQAKAGYGYVNYYTGFEYQTTSTGHQFIESNDDGSGLAYGLGINYQFNHHGLNIYYDIFPELKFEDDNKVTTSGFGIAYVYKF